MALFLQYVVPVFLLLLSIAGVYWLPADKVYQIMPAIFSGVTIFLLKSFLNIPDVVIDHLGKEMITSSQQDETLFFSTGTLINKSATGIGSIESLILRIFLGKKRKEFIDVPLEQSQPSIMGFRFEGHGVFPSNMLYFRFSPRYHNPEKIVGKPAQIRLKVVGQGMKIYRTIITSGT